MEIKVFVIVSIAISLVATAVNVDVGLAVYHTHNTPSACYGSQDNGPWITGVNAKLWNHRGACGKYYKVTCIGGANQAPHPCKPGYVIVKVTDLCKNCTGDLNLSEEAFTSIADWRAGKVRIRFELHEP